MASSSATALASLGWRAAWAGVLCSGVTAMAFVGCGEEFTPGPGGGGATSTSTGIGGATPTGTSSGGGGATASGTPGGVGAAPPVGGAGGAGGVGHLCDHSLCLSGLSLDPTCHPCVYAICEDDPFCCTQSWDQDCISAAWWKCQLRCGAGGTVSCQQQYGRTPGYFPCTGTQNECRFLVDPVFTTCKEACETGGGLCVAVEGTDGSCTPFGGSLSCETTILDDFRCVCSRGCDGGEPCPENQTCDELSGCQ